jgi:hypothetical protein
MEIWPLELWKGAWPMKSTFDERAEHRTPACQSVSIWLAQEMPQHGRMLAIQRRLTLRVGCRSARPAGHSGTSRGFCWLEYAL